MYADLLQLTDEAEYRQHFYENYCCREIKTHDGYVVTFRMNVFDHAFFSNADWKACDKSIFSIPRAERMDWIKKVLQDPTLTMYAGWDKKKGRYDHTRRVTLVTPDGYVVVLRVSKKGFVFGTAFVINDSSVEGKVKSNPVWAGEHLFR